MTACCLRCDAALCLTTSGTENAINPSHWTRDELPLYRVHRLLIVDVPFGVRLLVRLSVLAGRICDYSATVSAAQLSSIRTGVVFAMARVVRACCEAAPLSFFTLYRTHRVGSLLAAV